jgi:hypothetical protein
MSLAVDTPRGAGKRLDTQPSITNRSRRKTAKGAVCDLETAGYRALLVRK